MQANVVLIANPEAGSSRMRTLQSSAARIGATLLSTGRRGDAERMAREAANAGCRIVIACGGDGTINEAINGLAGSATPLGIVAMGTANVLAYEAGLPMDTASALEAALTRTPRPIALGRITLQGASRYFALMAGAGYDAEVVHGVRGSYKRTLGKAAYIISGTAILALWHPQPMPITLDGVRRDCYSAIISNSRQYAGDFTLAPEADIASPSFIATLITGPARRDIARLTWGLVTGSRVRAEGLTQIRCHEVGIESDVRLQIDGDYLGRGPASITSIPAALMLAY